MRTGLMIRTGIAYLTLWGSLAHGQAGTSALTAIRYVQQPAGSRLTLQFEGEIRYAVSRGNDRLVLTFPGTTLATPTGARTLQFKDGLVRSVATGRAGVDSIMVVVALREGTKSTLMRPSTGNALHLDVVKDPDSPAIPAKPATVTPAKAPRRDKALSQPSPVDIPTLVRSQVEERRRTTETAALAVLPVASEAAPPPTAGGWEPKLADILVIASAVILSVGSTLAFLLFLHRRANGTPAAPPAAVRVVLPGIAHEVPDASGAPGRMDEVIQEETEPMFDDRVQMAKIFQRGKEEVNLAVALHARSAPRANKLRLAQVVDKRGSNAQRRTAARKLGVGVGEVELALHLKNMLARTKQKEGAK